MLGFDWNHALALRKVLVHHIVQAHASRHVTGFKYLRGGFPHQSPPRHASLNSLARWLRHGFTASRLATLMSCFDGDRIRAEDIEHIPHWVYHGERDDVSPISASRQMVDASKKQGGEVLELSERWFVGFVTATISSFRLPLSSRPTRLHKHAMPCSL